MPKKTKIHPLLTLTPSTCSTVALRGLSENDNGFRDGDDKEWEKEREVSDCDSDRLTWSPPARVLAHVHVHVHVHIDVYAPVPDAVACVLPDAHTGRT